MRIAREVELKGMYSVESCSSNGERTALSLSWTEPTDSTFILKTKAI